MSVTQNVLFSKIAETIATLDIKTISKKRILILNDLIEYIQFIITQNKKVSLVFICTHNSRRSHLAQVWAQSIAHHFLIKNVFCFSAGTEATSVYPVVIETLKDSGFKVNVKLGEKNPVYAIQFSDQSDPINCFSKTIEDKRNPKSEFCAVMTCAEANEYCPMVTGAEIRVPITYEDPKSYDYSPIQKEKYKERSIQIATEMYYVFSKVVAN
jgi:arsenate reductase